MVATDIYTQKISNEEIYAQFVIITGRLVELERKFEECMIQKEDLRIRLQKRCCITGEEFCECHKNNDVAGLLKPI